MGEDRKYTDPELEKFVRENRDMIEKFLKAEGESFKERYYAEKSRAETAMNDQKEKVRELIGVFTDPEVQRHFMMAGFELFMGINAIMKAAPVPDAFKDIVDKTEEARVSAMENVCKANSECPKKPAQKVDIASTAPKTGKKKPSPE